MAVKQVTREEGRIVYFAGASRSGKSLHTVKAAKRHKRLLIWDPDDEWQAHGATRLGIRDIARLKQVCNSPHAGQYAFVAPATPEYFDAFCAWALLWIEHHPGAIVVDELADVTNAGKASAPWGVLLRRGKKRGAHLYVVSNSPAESDKTALKNADELHVHTLTEPPDIKRMAHRLGVPYEAVQAVRPWQSLSKTDLARPPALTGDLRPDLRNSDA